MKKFIYLIVFIVFVNTIFCNTKRKKENLRLQNLCFKNDNSNSMTIIGVDTIISNDSFVIIKHGREGKYFLPKCLSEKNFTIDSNLNEFNDLVYSSLDTIISHNSYKFYFIEFRLPETEYSEFTVLITDLLGRIKGFNSLFDGDLMREECILDSISGNSIFLTIHEFTGIKYTGDISKLPQSLQSVGITNDVFITKGQSNISEFEEWCLIRKETRQVYFYSMPSFMIFNKTCLINEYRWDDYCW